MLTRFTLKTCFRLPDALVSNTRPLTLNAINFHFFSSHASLDKYKNQIRNTLKTANIQSQQFEQIFFRIRGEAFKLLDLGKNKQAIELMSTFPRALQQVGGKQSQNHKVGNDIYLNFLKEIGQFEFLIQQSRKTRTEMSKKEQEYEYLLFREISVLKQLKRFNQAIEYHKEMIQLTINKAGQKRAQILGAKLYLFELYAEAGQLEKAQDFISQLIKHIDTYNEGEYLDLAKCSAYASYSIIMKDKEPTKARQAVNIALKYIEPYQDSTQSASTLPKILYMLENYMEIEILLKYYKKYLRVCSQQQQSFIKLKMMEKLSFVQKWQEMKQIYSELKDKQLQLFEELELLRLYGVVQRAVGTRLELIEVMQKLIHKAQQIQGYTEVSKYRIVPLSSLATNYLLEKKFQKVEEYSNKCLQLLQKYQNSANNTKGKSKQLIEYEQTSRDWANMNIQVCLSLVYEANQNLNKFVEVSSSFLQFSKDKQIFDMYLYQARPKLGISLCYALLFSQQLEHLPKYHKIVSDIISGYSGENKQNWKELFLWMNSEYYIVTKQLDKAEQTVNHIYEWFNKNNKQQLPKYQKRLTELSNQIKEMKKSK